MMISAMASLSTSATYSCPLNLYYSVFAFFRSSSSGGAISLSSSGCDLLTNNCIFFNDTSSGDGGAIYISGDNVTCVSTCFSNCSAVDSGLTIYTSTNNAIISDAEFSLSSGSAGTICINSQYLSYLKMNVTFNYASYSTSCILAECYFYRFGPFASFENNTDESGGSINLQGSAAVSNFTFSNYIGNNPGSTYGFIWSDNGAQGIFDNCVFLSNGNAAISALGSSSSPQYPILANCIFDVSSSRLSGCTLYSCLFGVSFATQVQYSILGIICIVRSGCFTAHYSPFENPMMIISYSLFLVAVIRDEE